MRRVMKNGKKTKCKLNNYLAIQENLPVLSDEVSIYRASTNPLEN